MKAIIDEVRFETQTQDLRLIGFGQTLDRVIVGHTMSFMVRVHLSADGTRSVDSMATLLMELEAAIEHVLDPNAPPLTKPQKAQRAQELKRKIVL